MLPHPPLLQQALEEDMDWRIIRDELKNHYRPRATKCNTVRVPSNYDNIITYLYRQWSRWGARILTKTTVLCRGHPVESFGLSIFPANVPLVCASELWNPFDAAVWYVIQVCHRQRWFPIVTSSSAWCVGWSRQTFLTPWSVLNYSTK